MTSPLLSQQSPSPAQSPPQPTRPNPSKHTKELFTPIEVPVPPPVVRGPLIPTSDPSSSSTSIAPTTADALPPTNSTALPETEFTTTSSIRIELTDEQMQHARKWTEERTQRKLRGEYERAGQQLSELVSSVNRTANLIVFAQPPRLITFQYEIQVNESLDTPLRLNSIRIVGAKTTRSSFLSSLVAPFLPEIAPPSYLQSEPTSPSKQHISSPPPQTLASLLNTTRDLSSLLSQFDIFRDIDAGLEQSPSVLAEPGDVDIVLRVKEAPKYFLRTATDVGDGEGSATATARIRNAFGGAEQVEGNIAFGTRTKSAFQLRVDTPINASPSSRAEVAVFSANRDLSYYASCGEYTKGAQAKIRTLTPFGLSELSYEAVLRNISDILPKASMSIRNAAGPTLKSSISHTLTRDTRDDLFAPTRGSFLRFKQEYAGLGGDAQFFKMESEGSTSRQVPLLPPGWAMSFGSRMGWLQPLNASKTSLFVDRYQLGGPTSMRQFRPNLMGPRDASDHLGGDLFWALGLSLTAPFPLRPHWPLKVHTFVNAGKLTTFDPNQAMTGNLKGLLREPSVSVGVGLMYRHSMVRIEGNVGVPLAMGKQEGAVKGLQFGLGMSFL
ncbi:BQ2448_2205 [Microbotryum intermedium]|uniref:BQ2448_2205 protein n=1 Tax=Microbotryum intermedium TaxID=269621 RepID=A0A238F7L3_9BASI|nr:BQ2448_2205 [Microbotryum intermedium]